MLPERGVAERTVRSRRRSTTRSIATRCSEVATIAPIRGSTPASGHRRTVHPGGAGVPVTAYPRDGHGRRPPPRTTEARLRQTTDPGQPPRGRPGDGRAPGSRRGRRSVRQPRPVHPGRDARGHAGPDGPTDGATHGRTHGATHAGSDRDAAPRRSARRPLPGPVAHARTDVDGRTDPDGHGRPDTGARPDADADARADAGPAPARRATFDEPVHGVGLPVPGSQLGRLHRHVRAHACST